MRFRKKPVVIEAIQFTGLTSWGQMQEAWGDQFRNAAGLTADFEIEDFLTIKTLEGDHRANMGDWIILGIKGEFYPCKPDIFEATYEPVE